MRLAELVMKTVGLVGRAVPFKSPPLVLLQAMEAAHGGQSGEAAERLERLIGLSADDYSEPSPLADRLATFATGANPEIETTILVTLVGILGMEHRHADGLALLEADLGLAGEDFEDLSRISTHLDRRLAGLSQNLACTYFITLVVALGVAARDQDALRTLSAGPFGIHMELGPDEICAQAESYLQMLHGEVAAGFLLFLSPALVGSGRLDAGLRLMKSYLGFNKDQAPDPAVLASRLAGLNPNIAAQIIVSAILTLEFGGRSTEALALVFSDLGLPPDIRQNPPDLAARLEHRLEGVHPDPATTYLRIFAGLLGEVDRSSTALGLLEQSAGFSPATWDHPEDLAHRLGKRFENVGDAVAGAFFFEFVSGLQNNERHRHAALLVDIFFKSFESWTDPDGAVHGLVTQLCPLFTYWLRYFGQNDAAEPVAACRRFMPFLRRGFVHQGVDLQDRSQFIRYVRDLRLLLVEVGRYWAEREQDAERARSLRLEVELWDAELAQRLLFEHFLLSRILLVPASETPTETWAFAVPRPAGLSEEALGRIDSLGFLSESWSAPGGDDPSPETAGRAGTEARQFRSAWPELYDEVRALVEQGIDPARLAELIGPGSLFVRASFGSRGQIVWSAIESDGKRPELRAFGSSADHALDRLRWATARHDFRLAITRLRVRPDFRKKAVLQQICEALGRATEAAKQGADELSTALGEIFTHPPDALEEMVQSLLTFILSGISAPPDLELIEKRLSDEIAFVKAPPAPAPSLRTDLDALTAAYLAEVAEVWNLDRLSPVLSPDHDLVLQVDDALHAVPVAHLPIAGRPLWRQVRSVRTTLALLVTAMTSRIDRQFADARASRENLLAVSHFDDPVDKAATGGRVLHLGLKGLAQTHGLGFYNAADRPPASLGSIRSACDLHQRFAAAVVCGHGDLYRSGIRLPSGVAEDEADVHWHGAGCDLSGVDWLWLVSCSLGRLRQNGDRDVQGFCVELILHRARSVSAFRWPVNAVEAAVFTHRAIGEYLKLSPKQRSDDHGRRRAWALNAARRSFLNDESIASSAGQRSAGQSSTQQYSTWQPGLNTIAACELYGAG